MRNPYLEQTGKMLELSDRSAKDKLIRDRKIRVIHVLLIAKLELKRRGWDKNNSQIRDTNACSMQSLVDFACINRLKNDSDFIVQRNIVYCVLNKTVESMSRGKYNDFTVWEQHQNSEAVVRRAIEKAITACTRSL